MSDLMIETHALRKEYGTQVALAGLDLQIRRGEVIGFVGPNGAGKSTLVKILTTLIAPTAGAARVAGFDVVSASLDVRRRIGYVPEDSAVFEALTGDEFLKKVIDLKGLDSKRSSAQVEELAATFEILPALKDQFTAYSKGMRRKALIVAALLGRPDVLILDEPLDGLDPKAVALLKKMFRDLGMDGTTIVFCSHDLDFVEKTSDRICVLSDGALVASGTVPNVLRETEARTLDAAFLHLTGSLPTNGLTEANAGR